MNPEEEVPSSVRWSEPPPDADPHRDVTGALHDVSNALTVLLGWASEARTGGLGAGGLERALAVIEEKAREARDVARRAIGAQIQIEDHDALLENVMTDVIETLSVEAERARVEVVLSNQSPGARIARAMDASRVLTNLVLNALAWSPKGGKVALEATAWAHEVVIAVEDEGPGVEAKSAPRLFDGAKSTRKGGAGIGLKHARALARAAGGELELASVQAGSGARFELRWPVLRPSMLPPAPMSSAGVVAVLAGSSVLVVEDDHDVAMLLESALEARGARVVVARTAAELERLAADRHDAALVDLSPIARDVRGAVEALRRGSPDLTLVFISGSAAGLPDALEGSDVRWVRKPFEVGEIVAALVEKE